MAEEEVVKREPIPMEDLGAGLKANDIGCTRSTANEVAKIAEVVRELVDSVGGDPEKVIADIEATIPLNVSQKKAIREKYSSNAVEIDGTNKKSYAFLATSLNSAARALSNMVE